MRHGALVLAGLAALAWPAAAAAPDGARGGSAELVIDFSGLRSDQGQVSVALYDVADDFAHERKPMAEAHLPAATAGVQARFPGLRPGVYAVKAYHDINGDGRLDKNALGIPSEPFVFSNDAHGRMGPASWGEAAFLVTGETRQSLRFTSAARAVAATLSPFGHGRRAPVPVVTTASVSGTR